MVERVNVSNFSRKVLRSRLRLASEKPAFIIHIYIYKVNFEVILMLINVYKHEIKLMVLSSKTVYLMSMFITLIV